MKYTLSFLIVLSFLLPPVPADAENRQQKASGKNEKVLVEDVIPGTMANLRAHKMLYTEGWYIVTSSSQAFAYAKEKSIIASKTALKRIARDAARHTAEYKETIRDDVRNSAETGRVLLSGGTELSKEILEKTHEIAKAELAYADDRFTKAMETFVRGNITIAKRTEEDRKELTDLPGNYFKNLKSDFSNIFELTSRARQRFSGKIDSSWEAAFRKAGSEFQAEYEKSGRQPNALMALGPILYGYLKSLYYGIAAPASRTIVKTTVAGTTYAVFLPVSTVSIVTGRTVQAVGLTVYYAGKTGVKIISPTLEGGLLSGLSLLSLGSVPATYAAGGAFGAINQVAFSTVGPVAAAAEGIGSTAAHSAGYAGFLAYDAVKGTTNVMINQAASGIVLGYNALSALPAHTFMGALDTAVFLAWDGPHLIIAAAKGKIKTADAESGVAHSIGDLPVGTVVDLKELRNTEGVEVTVLSTDSTVITNVLERIPDDVRAE